MHGGPVAVAAQSAQPLALVLHEMLSNAATHGALAAPGGAVDIAWEVPGEGDVVAIEWTETGGPPPPAEPVPGLGARLIDDIVRGQLGGRLERRWATRGLAARLTVKLPRGCARGAADQPRTTPTSANRRGSAGGVDGSASVHCQVPTSIQRPCL